MRISITHVTTDCRCCTVRYVFSCRVRKTTVRRVGRCLLNCKCTRGWDRWNTKNTWPADCRRAIIPRPNCTVRKTRDCHHRPTFIIAKNTLVKWSRRDNDLDRLICIGMQLLFSDVPAEGVHVPGPIFDRFRCVRLVRPVRANHILRKFDQNTSDYRSHYCHCNLYPISRYNFIPRFIAGDRRNVESDLGWTADHQRSDTLRNEGRHQNASTHRCRGDIRPRQSGNHLVMYGKCILTVVVCCTGQIRIHR